MVVAGFIVLRRLTARLDPRVTLASSHGPRCLGRWPAPPPRARRQRRRSDQVFPPPRQVRPLHRRQSDESATGDPPVGRSVRLRSGSERGGSGNVPAASRPPTPLTRTVIARCQAPHRRVETVVFLGDSFTFGWAVEDDETYPYVLATEHWTDLRIINAGVDGWGLTQCHLALTDMLARPLLPNAVIVSIVPDDLRRSHLRSPLVRGQRRRLEFIDGVFVPRDLYDRRVPETARAAGRRDPARAWRQLARWPLRPARRA